jgi:hypothetical protein
MNKTEIRFHLIKHKQNGVVKCVTPEGSLVHKSCHASPAQIKTKRAADLKQNKNTEFGKGKAN